MNRRAFLAGLGLSTIAACAMPAAAALEKKTRYMLVGEINGVTGGIVFTGARQFELVAEAVQI